MVSSGEDKVANETFVSINDEVATKFFGFFVVLNQLGRRHAFEITPYRLGKSH